MVQRLTYRRRHAYNTGSNKVKKVKTPGGKLNLQYLVKKVKGASCGDCGTRLPGLPAERPFSLRTLKKRQRTVSRAYGGSRCGGCVKTRIIRAFLIEEQKIVKHVLRTMKSAKKDAAAAAAAVAGKA
eukprot:gb/GEZN01020458.1/.p1 GENE.gb/GEZN01020458.1/~~gb/GEZN01020458.1/.p1  ORF type:complete len:127 (-),score=20.64 gb/GEZN01020458.1/:202-582(-)